MTKHETVLNKVIEFCKKEAQSIENLSCNVPEVITGSDLKVMHVYKDLIKFIEKELNDVIER